MTASSGSSGFTKMLGVQFCQAGQACPWCVRWRIPVNSWLTGPRFPEKTQCQLFEKPKSVIVKLLSELFMCASLEPWESIFLVGRGRHPDWGGRAGCWLVGSAWQAMWCHGPRTSVCGRACLRPRTSCSSCVRLSLDCSAAIWTSKPNILPPQVSSGSLWERDWTQSTRNALSALCSPASLLS